jgi:cation transport protein ChaC
VSAAVPGGKIRVPEEGDVWFFAYGSLMWDPGFEPAEVRPARAHGWHRQFCVWSRRYRGTATMPGLVFGLDRGGSCVGRVLRIAEPDRERVFAYLEEREMPEDIYSCRKVAVSTPQGQLFAYTLAVNRAHFLYASGMTGEAIAARIAACAGQRGPNLAYLENTVRHLDELGIADGSLHRLLDRAKRIAAGQDDACPATTRRTRARQINEGEAR